MSSTKDRVTMIVTITISTFMLLSLVGTFALEWAGKETGTIWGRIFDLINVLAGAVVGYIAGERVGKSGARKNLSSEIPEPDWDTGA